MYKTINKPAMMYRSECWAVNSKIEHMMSVVEMRILIWMSREDKIRN